MANTYTQLLTQLVFAVQGRENLIHQPIREKIEKYMCGCITNYKSKPLAIYCMNDHVHILIGQNPSIAIADLVKEIKTGTTHFINNEKLIKYKFSWQEGYGAFSYSKSQLDKVVKYIHNQPIHHKKTTFREEYLDFLKKFEIEYKPDYLFNWIE
jgi:putative transposase